MSAIAVLLCIDRRSHVPTLPSRICLPSPSAAFARFRASVHRIPARRGTGDYDPETTHCSIMIDHPGWVTEASVWRVGQPPLAVSKHRPAIPPTTDIAREVVLQYL